MHRCVHTHTCWHRWHQDALLRVAARALPGAELHSQASTCSLAGVLGEEGCHANHRVLGSSGCSKRALAVLLKYSQ